MIRPLEGTGEQIELQKLCSELSGFGDYFVTEYVKYIYIYNPVSNLYRFKQSDIVTLIVGLEEISI